MVATVCVKRLSEARLELDLAALPVAPQRCSHRFGNGCRARHGSCLGRGAVQVAPSATFASSPRIGLQEAMPLWWQAHGTPQFWRTLQSSIAFYIERRASSAKSISFIEAFDSFRLACDPLCSLQALDVFIEVPLQRWPASVHMIWLHDGQSWTQSEVMLEIYIFGETASLQL